MAVLLRNARGQGVGRGVGGAEETFNDVSPDVFLFPGLLF